MQSSSSSLNAAISAAERVIRHEVTVDWDNDGVQNIDDLSHKVGDIKVTQSLESSLPTQVRVVPGAAVAQLDATLARGNATRYDISCSYKSISTASSGSTTSSLVTINRPSGVLPGDIVVVGIFTLNSSNAQSLLSKANIDWATLAIRGDGLDFTNRIEMQCYMRRVIAAEPLSYTFGLAASETWAAVAVRIGDPGIMGLHAITSKGYDDDTTTYPILTTPSITTRLPSCTVISFFGANSPVTGATWSPLDGDIEQADIQAQAAGGDVCTVAVMTADNVQPGVYQKRATLATGASVTSAVAITLAFAPRLAGDEYQHAAWTFSELNRTSPYAGKNRFGRRTSWQVGLYTDAGLEKTPIFTGLSVAGSGSSRSRTAGITALDNREYMRDVWWFNGPLVAENPVVLTSPPLPFYPGLETTYLVSQQFAFVFTSRSNLGIYTPEKQGAYGGYGYFVSPHMRPSGILWAPCHGSMEAFLGQGWWAYTQLTTGVKRRVKFSVGPYVAGTEQAPQAPGFIDVGWIGNTSFANVFTLQNQYQGRSELWGRFASNTGSLEFKVMDASISPTRLIRLVITALGTMTVFITMLGGVTRTIVGPTIPIDGAWHFYGVHVDTPSGTALFRIDGVTTTVPFATWGNSASPSATLFVNLLAFIGAQASELHLSGGTLDDVFSPPITDVTTLVTPWLNENFVPTAFIDKSENELDTMPFFDISADTWTFLAQLAEAEFAALYFDAHGYPHFRNTRSDVNTVGQTVQKTLQARVNVKDLDYSSEVQSVRNVIDVGYSPHIAFIDQVAWSPSGTTRLSPGSVLSVTIQMPGVVLAIQGFNAFDGNVAADGSGTVVPSSLLPWSVNSRDLYGIEISITNTYYADVYLVDATGQPSPKLTATWMGPDASQVTPERRTDVNSVRRYREQPLSISTTVWRQRQSVAASQAIFLVSQLGAPTPVIHNVPIVGDPRLELGDRATLVDVNGLGVSDQFRTTAIDNHGSQNGGFEQSLTVRQATTVARWNVNNWNDGSAWGI